MEVKPMPVVPLALFLIQSAYAGSLAALDAKRGFQTLQLGSDVSYLGSYESDTMKCYKIGNATYVSEGFREGRNKYGWQILGGSNAAISYPSVSNGCESHFLSVLAPLKWEGVDREGKAAEFGPSYIYVSNDSKVIGFQVRDNASVALKTLIDKVLYAYGPPTQTLGKGCANIKAPAVNCSYRWLGETTVLVYDAVAYQPYFNFISRPVYDAMIAQDKAEQLKSQDKREIERKLGAGL